MIFKKNEHYSRYSISAAAGVIQWIPETGSCSQRSREAERVSAAFEGPSAVHIKHPE